jgi:nicotinamidase-related amidase
MAPGKDSDLHGSAPDDCAVALLLIDVINALQFPEGEQLLAHARPMARQLATLKRRARDAGVPCIYVNDNFGRWRSDFREIVRHCTEEGALGRPIVLALMPEPDDYFVLKPKHSGFFASALDVLLAYLKVRTVVLTGMATNLCVLYTANDAYMRDLRLVVPSDCVAANTVEESEFAVRQMERSLKATVSPSGGLDFEDLKL